MTVLPWPFPWKLGVWTCGSVHASVQMRFLTRPIINVCFLSPQPWSYLNNLSEVFRHVMISVMISVEFGSELAGSI